MLRQIGVALSEWLRLRGCMSLCLPPQFEYLTLVYILHLLARMPRHVPEGGANVSVSSEDLDIFAMICFTTLPPVSPIRSPRAT